MGVCCGVDLGLTHASIAYFNQNAKRVQPVWLKRNGGTDRIPSIVGPPHTVRHCGERETHSVGSVVKATGLSSASLPAAAGGTSGTVWTSREMMTFLTMLVQEAEAFANDTVERLVLAIPSCLPDEMILELTETVRRTDLPDTSVVPDLWAAARAVMGEQQDSGDQHLVVVNLGATLCESGLVTATTTGIGPAGREWDVQLLCRRCNPSLGGNRWTEALAQLVLASIGDSQAPANGRTEWEARLLERCEAAKRQLTHLASVEVVVDDTLENVAVMSRDQLDKSTAHLLNQTKACISDTVLAATRRFGLDCAKLRCVVAGGGSRMPAVQRLVRDLIDQPVKTAVQPEHVVVTGATLAACGPTPPCPPYGVENGAKPVVPVTSERPAVSSGTGPLARALDRWIGPWRARDAQGGNDKRGTSAP